MKKKIIFMIVLLFILALAGSITLADRRGTVEGESLAREIGLSMKGVISELLSKDDTEISLYNVSDGDVFAVVMDEAISQEYFNVRASLYKATGEVNPEVAAWESIKTEIAERKFAEEQEIMPSEEEVIAFINQMREEIESTEESYVIGRTLIETAGMTWDQYWNEYKPVYEAPAHLIKINIAKYCEENNLLSIDFEDVEYEMINENFIDKF